MGVTLYEEVPRPYIKISDAAIDWPDYVSTKTESSVQALFETHAQASLQTIPLFEAYLDAAESLSFEAHTKDFRDLLDLLWWETQHNYPRILQNKQQRSDPKCYYLDVELATPRLEERKELWNKLFNSLKTIRSRLEKFFDQSRIDFLRNYCPKRISAYSPIELLARCKVYNRTWSNFEDFIQDTSQLPRAQPIETSDPIQGPPRCLALMCIRDDNGNCFIITGASKATVAKLDILDALKVRRQQAHEGRLTQEEKAVYNKACDDYRTTLLKIDGHRDGPSYNPSTKAIRKVFLTNQPIHHYSSGSFGDGPMATTRLTTDKPADNTTDEPADNTTDKPANNTKLAHRFDVATMSARTVAFNTEMYEVMKACNRCHILCLSNQLSVPALDEILNDTQMQQFRKLFPALACAEVITNAHACRLLHPRCRNMRCSSCLVTPI